MAETAVKSKICDICGAEVRAGSLFCYNCGGSVTKNTVEERPVSAEPVPKPIVSNGDSRRHAAKYDPARRRSEKADRRTVRAANRQPVEIEWEPRTSTSWAFVIITVVLALLSLLIVVAAFYVR